MQCLWCYTYIVQRATIFICLYMESLEQRSNKSGVFMIWSLITRAKELLGGVLVIDKLKKTARGRASSSLERARVQHTIRTVVPGTWLL